MYIIVVDVTIAELYYLLRGRCGAAAVSRLQLAVRLSSVAAQPSVGKCHRGQQNNARLPVCEDVNLFPMCTVPELNFSIVITWTKVSLFLFCTEVRTLYLYTSHDPFPHQMKQKRCE